MLRQLPANCPSRPLLSQTFALAIISHYVPRLLSSTSGSVENMRMSARFDMPEQEE